MWPNQQAGTQRETAERQGKTKYDPQVVGENNRDSGQSDQMLPLYSMNANSVNASELIFRAREIYEKYRSNQVPGTNLPTQNYKPPHIAPPYHHHVKSRQQQHDYPSIKGSFKTEQQIHQNNYRFVGKEPKTAETVPSITNFLHEVSGKSKEKFNDFLYLMIGIFSSHIRVHKRQGFQNIYQHQKSVKKNTGFSIKVNGIMRKRLGWGFQRLKQNKIVAHERKTKQVEKKYTKIDSLRSSNLEMEESTVQKGLKYLQQRSDQRRRLQQKMKVNQYGVQARYGQSTSPSHVTGSTFQFNHHQIQKKMPDRRIVVNQSESVKSQKHQKIIPVHHKKVEEEYEDIYLRTARQNQNKYRPASWLGIELNDSPLLIKNKGQIFDRNETSERKYYLNPNTFKQSDPDTNEGFIPIVSNFAVDDLSIYEPDYELDMQKKFGEKTTTDVNLLEDTLPIFDPTNNQNATRAWQPPYNRNQQLQKNISNNKITKQFHKSRNNWFDQRQFDNLPSFNEKNRIVKGDSWNKKRQEDERERRKSDLMGYRSGENSFKISEEGDEMHDENRGSHHKLHRLNQYYTDNNVLSNKKSSIRASVEFTRPKRPASRPKSMTQYIRKDLQPKIMESPASRPSSNMNHEQDAKKQATKVTINYQSPMKEAKMELPIHHHSIYQPIPNPHPQTKITFQNNPVAHFVNYHPQVQNKPLRAVSSEARFFGNFQPHVLPNQFIPPPPQGSVKLIREQPVIQSYYGMPPLKNTNQLSPKPSPFQPQQLTPQKTKGIEVNTQMRPQLNHYGSQERLRPGQQKLKQPKTQLTSGFQSSRKLKVVSAQYYH